MRAESMYHVIQAMYSGCKQTKPSTSTKIHVSVTRTPSIPTENEQAVSKFVPHHQRGRPADSLH